MRHLIQKLLREGISVDASGNMREDNRITPDYLISRIPALRRFDKIPANEGDIKFKLEVHEQNVPFRTITLPYLSWEIEFWYETRAGRDFDAEQKLDVFRPLPVTIHEFNIITRMDLDAPEGHDEDKVSDAITAVIAKNMSKDAFRTNLKVTTPQGQPIPSGELDAIINELNKKFYVMEDVAEKIFNLDILKESVLSEKKIQVRPALVDRLQSADFFGRRLLMFLGGDTIKDKALADWIDIDPNNPKKFIVGYTDKMGNEKTRSLSIGKMLTYLGSDIEDVQGYDKENVVSKMVKADTSRMRLYRGPEIMKALSCRNHAGNLGSCMTDLAETGIFEMFIKNPRQVSALVSLNDKGEVEGRALIWDTSDGLYMDRIYVADNRGDIKAKFETFKREFGMERSITPASVQLDNGGMYDRYPFMDTFIYYNPEKGILSSIKGPLVLRDKNGGYAKR